MKVFIFFLTFFCISFSQAALRTPELAGNSYSQQPSYDGEFLSKKTIDNILIDIATGIGIYFVGKQLEPDKAKHLYAGAIVGKIGSWWCGANRKSSDPKVDLKTELRKRKALCALGAGAVAGILKEMYDMASGKEGDMEDVFVTVTGSGVVSVVEASRSL